MNDQSKNNGNTKNGVTKRDGRVFRAQGGLWRSNPDHYVPASPEMKNEPRKDIRNTERGHWIV